MLLPPGVIPGGLRLDGFCAARPEEIAVTERAEIGRISVEVKNIFDVTQPGEDRLLFRAANHLHRTTRDHVIREQLLFRSGDPYDPARVAESERLLRDRRYIGEARIEATRRPDNQVDLDVVTQDVWTLNVGAGVGRSGGVNSTRFQLQDTNFLGTGKSLTLERSSTVDRTETLARYDDRNVWGSRLSLSALYSSNSDGERREFNLEQPFYSISSRWMAGGSFADDDRVDTLYTLGHVSAGFRHRAEFAELRGGYAHLLSGRHALRFTGGFTWDRQQFAAEPGFDLPGGLPAERKLAYPWVGLDFVGDHFDKTRDFDKIGRTEDLELGNRLHLRLGYSSSLFNALDAAVFDASGRVGRKLTEDQTLLLDANFGGRWEQGGPRNMRLGAAVRYYWRDFGEQLFYATLEGDLARHLDPENQLLLGGDSGLRGYPLRYQDGDRRLLLTLEQRIFTKWYPFKLVHVGGAVFFDLGQTWSADESLEAHNLGTLRDIGLGLRLAPSRSGLGAILHLDVAFPLDGDPSISRTQFLVSTKATF
jgi:outer membrane protein assembly factor BamA